MNAPTGSPPARKWYEYRHRVTFGDTNAAGNVYFARYFDWQGECREALLAEFYPEFADDFGKGFCLVTEFAHQDFLNEAHLFDQVVIRATVASLSRTRVEFEFEFVRASDGQLLSQGRQAVVWTNQQHRPSLMPDKLYETTARYFDIRES